MDSDASSSSSTDGDHSEYTSDEDGSDEDGSDEDASVEDAGSEVHADEEEQAHVAQPVVSFCLASLTCCVLMPCHASFEGRAWAPDS